MPIFPCSYQPADLSDAHRFDAYAVPGKKAVCQMIKEVKNCSTRNVAGSFGDYKPETIKDIRKMPVLPKFRIIFRYGHVSESNCPACILVHVFGVYHHVQHYNQLNFQQHINNKSIGDSFNYKPKDGGGNDSKN